jgi:hypothetical protein
LISVKGLDRLEDRISLYIIGWLIYELNGEKKYVIIIFEKYDVFCCHLLSQVLQQK